jgi:predicted Zn-dependent protease
MERDFWFTVARSVDGLESPESVGRKAAERALRRLGAKKVPTQKAPIVFDPRVARSLLDNVFDAISGDSIYRGESFLADKMGQKGCVGEPDRHRRCHHPEAVRVIALRRRRNTVTTPPWSSRMAF